MPATRKPSRAKKGKKEKTRLEKTSTTRIVGEGFVQRVKNPKRAGKHVKSVMLRVDAGFADWVRKQAAVDGSITTVTRKLHQRLVQSELDAKSAAMEKAVTL